MKSARKINVMVSGDCHCGYLSNTHIDKRKFLKVKAQHKNLALAA